MLRETHFPPFLSMCKVYIKYYSYWVLIVQSVTYVFTIQCTPLPSYLTVLFVLLSPVIYLLTNVFFYVSSS
jgi:hypothetical protein